MWGHLVNDRSAMHHLLPPFLKLATHTGMSICDGALFLTAIASFGFNNNHFEAL